MVKIVLEYKPVNQMELEKKFIRLLLEKWDRVGSFVEYLRITLPIMWAGYVKLN